MALHDTSKRERFASTIHMYTLIGMACKEQVGGRVAHGSQLRGFQPGVRGNVLCMSRRDSSLSIEIENTSPRTKLMSCSVMFACPRARTVDVGESLIT
jgi:hypothetical protein